ncbi:MAG: NUDIX hydrolase [Chloroflexota bacterium]|nr:MAG: NUDIX hydrolase [Chloroflexota bacterium]
MAKRHPQPWQRIRTEAGSDLKIFQVRFNWLQNPRNSTLVKATQLEAPDWVNVVALTPEKKVIIVRQYRFGTESVTAEIPAGTVEKGESSQTTAARELKEETGYTSSNWEYLGYTEPNPAFLNNKCHLWLAKDVKKTHPVELDAGEDVFMELMTLEELRQEIDEGRLRHSLALVALSRVFGKIW